MNNDNILNIRKLGPQWETRDPFLFCAHHEDHYPAGNDKMQIAAEYLNGRNIGQDFSGKDGWSMYHGQKAPGFPAHPHRGFETITVVRTGFADHSDSMGAKGRFGNGDVQWMTAGKGVQHSEMFPLLNKNSDNPLELFQIWLNLPKKSKMVEPHYKMLWTEDIPIIEIYDKNEKKTHIEVIAGKLLGHNPPTPPPDSWASDENSHIAIWNIIMEEGAEWELERTHKSSNRSLYFYKGHQLSIDGKQIDGNHAVDVNPSSGLNIKAEKGNAEIILMQGAPIGEAVAQHGPFVMNTREEIMQTFEEYRKTQFGGWPWKTNDPVHARNSDRFALHSDGRMEKPESN